MPSTRALQSRRRGGLTLLELLLAMTIASVLMAALFGVVGESLAVWTASRSHLERLEQARFAMERMTSAVRGTSRLLLPLAENPATAWSESVRDVLAVALDPTLDRDDDGFADADNDRDGRVDEDPGRDANDDGKAGIRGIDDDGDGNIDEVAYEDDDEDDDDAGDKDEDAVNGLDDDGDGAVDEDPDHDFNGDGEAGVAGVDDDGDGDVDEGSNEDDDEDEGNGGDKNEDWIDSVVFFVSGGTLWQRLPNPHATSGLDYQELALAEDVTELRVERILAPRAVLIDLELEIGGAEGVRLRTQVRVGDAP